MREEERTFTRTFTKSVYVTEDGEEFERYMDARRHEIVLQYNKELKWVDTYLNTLDTNCTIYKIEDEKDFEYLFYVIGEQQGPAMNYYNGPGWYIDIINPGGDHSDWHTIIFLNDHIMSLEKEIFELKNLTSE